MVTAAAFVLRYGKAIMAGRLAGMAEEQTVTRIFGAPTRYVQGPGAIDSLGELTAGLTRRPLLVADAEVLTFIQTRLEACFGDRPHEILAFRGEVTHARSEEHTSELQSLMRNSYAVFCLKKTNNNQLK